MCLEFEFKETRPPRVPGLILPLSPLAPFGGADEQVGTHLNRLLQETQDPTKPLALEDQKALESSNLLPAMAALEYHLGKGLPQPNGTKTFLREVWLIETAEKRTDDSGEFERADSRGLGYLLERWFRSRNPSSSHKVVFHHTSYRGIRLVVHPRSYTEMWAVVDAIYEKAPYKSDQIIADITPGNKPMSIAIASACLKPLRTMQYMVPRTKPEDCEHWPAEFPAPMLIDIDPLIRKAHAPAD